MAQILAVLGYALFCKIMDEAGVRHNIGPVSADLLTIPLNSNDIPSGVIGDACNYERKTHNEAKAQKEMRENEARQRREDERIEEYYYQKYIAEREAERLQYIKKQEQKELEDNFRERLRNIQELNLLPPQMTIKDFEPSCSWSAELRHYFLDEGIKSIFKEKVKNIKPDSITERYVDIKKYNKFVCIYNEATDDFDEKKISLRTALRKQYDAKVQYDNEYWDFHERILKQKIELDNAYVKGVIKHSDKNIIMLELEKKQNMTIKLPTVKAKPQSNSTLNNIGSGYVASAQARVNAVNLATTAVSTTARAVANGASAVGNAYIQGSNDMANTRRMEAQATQQLVSNVASAVGNGATAVANGFVNPSANSDQTNQVLNMVSNAPSAVDLCLSNPRGIGINIATGMLAEVNNSYNERSTTRNMVNGTIGAVGLVAGVVGAPTIATAIGGTALAVEYAEFANNIDTLINENTLPEHRPITRGLLSD
jgi:hypothetical protein